MGETVFSAPSSATLKLNLYLRKTYGILFPTLINADLPDCKRWKDVLSATFRTLRNALMNIRSKLSRGPIIGVDCRTHDLGDGAGRMAERPLRDEMHIIDHLSPVTEGWMGGSHQRRGRDKLTRRCLRQQQLRSPLLRASPNIVSDVLDSLKSVSILAVGMTLFGNIHTAGARSLLAKDIEKSSNFWFGVIASVAALFTIIGVLFEVIMWTRRHSIVGSSAASAPAGPILNGAGSSVQMLTIPRSSSETEDIELVEARREEEPQPSHDTETGYCEVLVARREEEEAHAL